MTTSSNRNSINWNISDFLVPNKIILYFSGLHNCGLFIFKTTKKFSCRHLLFQCYTRCDCYTWVRCVISVTRRIRFFTSVKKISHGYWIRMVLKRTFQHIKLNISSITIIAVLLVLFVHLSVYLSVCPPAGLFVYRYYL